MEKGDLIEQYLTNKLGKEDRQAFEKQLDNSAELREKVELQRRIIDGIKEARAEELKVLLNSLVISGPMSISAGKAALATLSVGIIGAILYFSIRAKKPDLENIEADKAYSIVAETDPLPSKEDTPPVIETPHDEGEGKVPDVTFPSHSPARSAAKDSRPQSQQPSSTKMSASAGGEKAAKLPVPPADDSNFLESLKTTLPSYSDATDNQFVNRKSTNLPSKPPIETELNEGDKRYPFHYRCVDDKLFLYGPFVKNLYELIEVSEKSSVLYLYYKGDYYYIDKKEIEIVPLKQVTDTDLIKQLGVYRGG